MPQGWTELPPYYGHPWVVVETSPDGDPVVRQLTDKQFTAEFEPTEQAWEARRDALLAWARWQLGGADTNYLRLNGAERDRAPWNDPVLHAERDRIEELVRASGTSYNETFDPDQPDRTLYVAPAPSTLRVTRDVAAVLRVLLEQPDQPIRGEEIAQRSALSWKTSRVLWRLKEAGWVETHRDGAPGPAAEHRWSLTETGARLASERLSGRTNNQGGTR